MHHLTINARISIPKVLERSNGFNGNTLLALSPSRASSCHDVLAKPWLPKKHKVIPDRENRGRFFCKIELKELCSDIEHIGSRLGANKYDAM